MLRIEENLSDVADEIKRYKETIRGLVIFLLSFPLQNFIIFIIS